MLSRMHNKLGTAGLVIAIIALVAAMTGGAYAALSPNDKRVVKKEAKKFSKKFSKQFAKPGPAGAPGATGPAGAKGDKGDRGDNGTNGTNGKSVVIGTATAGQCPDGGKTVEVEGSGVKNPVCNGADGEDGETGFTETLPPGETETGAWSTSNFAGSAGNDMFDVSFNIPLADGSAYTINYIDGGGETKAVGIITGGEEDETPDAANCPGSLSDPEALPGNLCLYADANSSAASLVRVVKEDEGAVILSNLGAFAFAGGTWAVTAPTAP